MDLANLALQELTDGLTDGTGAARGLDFGGRCSAEITLRRCRTPEQGKALLAVGHAIEYLLASRITQKKETTNDEREALAILLSANLSVYQEGAEILPLWSRLRHWFRGGAAKNIAIEATA